ncbi:MAG: hypothetical protein ACI952_002411 [Flavobacteriales bacterium]|jgi:hypothetical protein
MKLVGIIIYSLILDYIQAMTTHYNSKGMVVKLNIILALNLVNICRVFIPV